MTQIPYNLLTQLLHSFSYHRQRTGTDEFDMDGSDTYGTGAHLDAEAVAA